jgi:hypothetical protein
MNGLKCVCKTANGDQTVFEVDNKWHFIRDPYDESDSPKEAGYYRIIDVNGMETVDYFFGEPRMTSRGIGYWATSKKTIVAWSKLDRKI